MRCSTACCTCLYCLLCLRQPAATTQVKLVLVATPPNPTNPTCSPLPSPPPLPLAAGTSVFFALKEACYAARKEAGLEGWFRLDLPATPERLRMACADDLTAAFAAPEMQCKISC